MENEKEQLKNQLKELKKEKKRIDKKIQIINIKLHRQTQRKITDYEKKTCEELCKEVGILYEEVLSLSRNKEIIKAKRKISHYYKERGYSLIRIALLLGLNSHSSIINLLKKGNTQ